MTPADQDRRGLERPWTRGHCYCCGVRPVGSRHRLLCDGCYQSIAEKRRRGEPWLRARWEEIGLEQARHQLAMDPTFRVGHVQEVPQIPLPDSA